MDDLQLLRELRSDIGTPASATIARGRTKLMTNIDSLSPAVAGTRTPVPAPASPFRFPRRILVASAAAALLVGGIVVADVFRPGGQGATAEAAEVLNNAAAATIRTSDPVVAPGQYLKIETTARYGGSSVIADGTQVFWEENTGGQVYIPADRNSEWVWNREQSVPVEFSSEAAKTEALRLQEKAPSDMVGPQRAAGGAFYGSEQVILSGMPLEEAAGLPRDPQALLGIISERAKGAGKSPEIQALSTITAALRTGAIPADLRAAFFKAAALIPGVSVVDKQATIDGRTGVAIAIASLGGESRMETIIDPVTGLLIGERTITLKDHPGVPSGTVMTWTSVKTSVVDSAP